MNNSENKHAAKILSLVLNGSSIQDAMERVIGPGDWSNQAAQLEQEIEDALKSTYARVEDWHWEKAQFDGSNCGIGSGGFEPGNTCGAKDGSGGQKPKEKRARKKADPKAPKQTEAPKAARKPKSPPKPQHIARAKKAIASLSKSLRKMGQKTLKNLLSQIKAAKKALKKAPKTLKKKAKEVRSEIGKNIRTIKGRRKQKQQRKELRLQAQKLHPAITKQARESLPVLVDLYAAVQGDARLESVVGLAYRAQTAIASSPSVPKSPSRDDVFASLGGADTSELLKSLTPANLKRLVSATNRAIGPQKGKQISKMLDAIQRSAKKTQSLMRNWDRVESKKFSCGRIEDRFYAQGFHQLKVD